MSKRRVAGVIVLALALSGCGSDEPTGATAKLTLDVILHNTVIDENSDVVVGMELCVDGRPEIPCVTTDNLGIADLALPKNSELVVVYKKDGFTPKLREYTTGAETVANGLGTWIIQRATWYDQVAALLGGQLDIQTKGILSLQTDGGTGVDFAIDPHPQEIIGPFHAQVEGKIMVPCVSGTLCDLGVAAWGDVAPGMYRGIASGANLTCTPKGFACKDGTPGCVELESRAGYVTWADIPCK